MPLSQQIEGILYEQNLGKIQLGIVLLEADRNHYEALSPLISQVNTVLKTLQKGTGCTGESLVQSCVSSSGQPTLYLQIFGVNAFTFPVVRIVDVLIDRLSFLSEQFGCIRLGQFSIKYIVNGLFDFGFRLCPFPANPGPIFPA